MKPAKRRFVRHPSTIPLDCRRLGEGRCRRARLRDIGRGGLCFRSREAFAVGEPVRLRLAIAERAVEAEAQVAWVRRARRGGWEIGVHFPREQDAYAVRMVEQVCHIEAYRREVLRREGRRLSSEAAAAEWIERHAADFP